MFDFPRFFASFDRKQNKNVGIYSCRVRLCHPQNKDASYETAVASEKRDSKETSNHNDSDHNSSSKFSDFGDDEFCCIGMGSDTELSPPMSPSPPLASSPTTPKIVLPFTPEKEKRRRSISWQSKLERRRRKTSSTADADENNADDLPESPNNYSRQKRHSWWNILVPDNIKHRWLTPYINYLLIIFIGFFNFNLLRNALHCARKSILFSVHLSLRLVLRSRCYFRK